MKRALGLLILMPFLQNCSGDFMATHYPGMSMMDGMSMTDGSSTDPSVVVTDPPVTPVLRSVKWDASDLTRTLVAISADGLMATKDDGAAEARRSVYATFAPASGAYYFEVQVTQILSSNRQRIGLASENGRVANDTPTAAASYGLDFDGSFSVHENGAYANAPLTTALQVGDVVGIYLSVETGFARFYVNGVKVNDVLLQAGHKYSPFFFGSINSNGSVRANFGKSPYVYPPSVLFEKPDNT